MSDPADRQKLVLEEYLQGLHHEGGYWHGYLKSHDEVEHFEKFLASVNVKYSVRTSRDWLKGKVAFSMIHCGRRISFDNVPFRVFKETVKICCLGVEHYKTSEKQRILSRIATDWPKGVYQKEKVCRATLNFKHIVLYPDFKADLPQPCGQVKAKRIKSDTAKQLNEALKAKTPMTTEGRIYVAVADCNSHSNHGFGEIEAFSQGVDEGILTHSDVLDVGDFEAPQKAPSPEREALGSPAASVLRKAIAEECEKCSLVLQYCHDVDALLEAKEMVESAFRRLAESAPNSSAVQIRGSPTNGCSLLKPLPKRRCL